MLHEEVGSGGRAWHIRRDWLIDPVDVQLEVGSDGLGRVVGHGGAIDLVYKVIARCPDVDGRVV